MARARTLTLNTKVNVTGADKLRGLGSQLQSVGRNLTAGLTLPIVGLGGALVAMAEEAARADAELTRTFDSMGAAAWTTVDALKAQQRELQGLTTFGDEEISHLQSVLLTFGNVTGDSFDRATKAALDMSTMLGQDLQSSAIQLGKALNDPIQGITALTRVGVSFTAAQKEQIRAMAEAGDVMGAQGLILDELERQFGGAAEAIAQTAGGQLKQALNELSDAGEEFGAIIAPMLRDVAGALKGLARWLRELNPETKEWVIRMGALLAAIGPVLIVLGTFTRAISFLVGAQGLSALVRGLSLARLGFLGLAGAIGVAGVAVGQQFNDVISSLQSELLVRIGEQAGKTAQQVREAVNEISTAFGTDLPDAEKRLIETLRETGGDWDEAMERLRLSALVATDETGRAFLGAGSAIAQGLNTAITETRGAIEDSGIPEEVMEEVQSAAERAREEARRIPFEISQGIIEGRDEVVKAAFQLAEAATDELVNDQRIAEAREKMAELANLTAEEIEAATPATEAARKAELAALEIQLAGYLLRADPLNEEAASLLRRHMESEDPATQAAAEALMGAVEDRAFIMQHEVEEAARAAGVSIPFALREAKRDAANEARLLREGVKAHLDRLQYDGYNAGASLQYSLAAGMGAERWRVYAEAVATAAAIRGQLPSSEPKDPNSPLRGITKGFGFGRVLAQGILSGRSAVQSAMQSVLGLPSLAAVPLTSGSLGTPGPVTNINLTVQGDLRARDADELAATVLRTQTFAAVGVREW